MPSRNPGDCGQIRFSRAVNLFDLASAALLVGQPATDSVAESNNGLGAAGVPITKEKHVGDKKKPAKQKKKPKKEPDVLVTGRGGKSKKKK